MYLRSVSDAVQQVGAVLRLTLRAHSLSGRGLGISVCEKVVEMVRLTHVLGEAVEKSAVSIGSMNSRCWSSWRAS
jgi:hypothetical protein